VRSRGGTSEGWLAHPPPGITAFRILGGMTWRRNRKGLGVLNTWKLFEERGEGGGRCKQGYFGFRRSGMRAARHLVEFELFALQDITLAGCKVKRRVCEILGVWSFVWGREEVPRKCAASFPALMSLTRCTTWGYLMKIRPEVCCNGEGFGAITLQRGRRGSAPFDREILFQV
jgi:hypothetical protein